MAIRIEEVESGRRFLQVKTEVFRDFINPIIRENAYILMDKSISLKEEREWQKRNAKEIKEGKRVVLLAWDGKKLVGICDAWKGQYKERFNASVGIVISKGYRGKGLGRELLSCIILRAKAKLKPHKIHLDCFAGNKTAQCLYHSIGFVEVARLRGHLFHCGKYVDKLYMELRK